MSKPTTMEEADRLRYQLHEQKLHSANLEAGIVQERAAKVKADRDAFVQSLLNKYEITPEDKVNLDTGAIERAIPPNSVDAKPELPEA